MALRPCPNATRWRVWADRLGRGLHGEPRPVHRQHRLPRPRSATSPAPASPTSPGSSTPTRSCSPRCSCPPGGSPTAPGASAASSAASPLFIAASALCARVAPSSELLVAARVLQAAGAAFMVPTSLGLLLPEFPPAQRATAVGAWAAVGGVAAAAGPPIGGLLVEASWRWVFLVNLPVGLVTLFIAARALREHREPAGTPRPDLLGAPAARRRDRRCSASASSRARTGAGTARAWSASFAAAAALLAAVRPALRAPSRAGCGAADAARALVRGRQPRRAALLRVLLARCCSAACSSSPACGAYSVLEAGLALAPGPLMAALFSFPSGKLNDRFGQRVVGVARRPDLRARRRVVDLAGGRGARLRRRAAPRHAADRHRRRPHDSDAVERRRRIAAAEPLRDGHRACSGCRARSAPCWASSILIAILGNAGTGRRARALRRRLDCSWC